jgi:cytochrome c-type biogenesis protein CcmH/NrfF
MVPVLAVALAALSAGLGQVAQAQILAQPDKPITFVVDEGLPYGITQERVDAAARGRALSYEPFTIVIVERALTWEEYDDGELPDGADVMLSVGVDQDDPDLVLPAGSRASVAKVAADGDSTAHYRVATEIRETFLNNLTQGHGPNAVVGAALTAASRSFDGGPRSPVLWVSLAALPLLVGLFMMALWARYLARERNRQRIFSRARLELARVVLELDILEAHVDIAGAELDRGARGSARNVAKDVKEKLRTDWSTIREDSLDLAHEEQVLTRELLDPSTRVHERRAPEEPLDLSTFAKRTAALRRRAEALVAASSLRVGHAAGGTILGQIALTTTLPVDDVLARPELLSATEAANLSRQRGDLLALVREADTAFGGDDGPEIVVRHADLMTRWRAAERRLAVTLTKIQHRLEKKIPRGTTSHVAAGVLGERLAERTRVATGGSSDTVDELRASLDLTPRKGLVPAHHAERILLIAEAIEGGKRGSTRPRRAVGGIPIDKLAPDFTPLAVVGLPVIVALIAGFTATSAMDRSDATYGRELTGDVPLASLQIVGDLARLPAYNDPTDAEREPPNIETLSLDFVRDAMERTAERSDDDALFPEKLDLAVALLPIDDYVAVLPNDEIENGVKIDYFDLLEAYPRIKAEVEAEVPGTVDPATGDVRPGHAILPFWIRADGSYGVGLALTGTLSTGMDSRLGAYDFVATQPRFTNEPGEDWALPAGWVVTSALIDLARQLEYNNLKASSLAPAALFWVVALATWTGIQAFAMILWSLAQLLLRNSGSRRTRREVRALRDKLNALALGLDLSRLDAVAVLGTADNHRGRAAEADQQLYETVLFTAWREVQALEALPRREQRGPEWRQRVERMGTVIDALAEREAGVAERALVLIRSYS